MIEVRDVSHSFVARSGRERVTTRTGGAMMAGVWRESGTLQVERREPHMTRASKITPLHVEQQPLSR